MPVAPPTRPPRRWPGARACAIGCAAMLLTLPVATGCSGSPPSPASPTAGVPSSGSFLADPAAVETLLTARFGGSPTMRRLIVWSDAVSAEVRDPAKPENLDTHSFRGGQWSTAPVRVSMSEIEELDARVFTLADLDLTKVPGLIAMALEGLDLEGEAVSAVSFDRLAGEPARVYIGVEGLRGSGSLIADADGSDPHIRRN